MEPGDEVRCMDVAEGEPRVVTGVITLPLHQIFQSSVTDPAVEDVFHFVFLFSAYEYRRGRRIRATTGDPIRVSKGQFDYGEYRGKAT